MIFTQVKHLIAKEITLEIRQKYVLNSILLYVVSTVFISHLTFKQVIQAPTWNALFWIIILFASINAVSKSFVQEGRGRQLYLYTLASPEAIIISKIVYNMLLMIVLSVLCLLSYTLLFGNLVQDIFLFSINLVLGSIGFSSILTMVSAISSKTNNNFTLMAILSFPLIIPLLMTLIHVSKNAIDGLELSVSYFYIGILLAMNVIIVILSYLLFPYLWRD